MVKEFSIVSELESIREKNGDYQKERVNYLLLY